jgi:hypothetical protein
VLEQDRLGANLDRSALGPGENHQVLDQALQVLGLVVNVADELGPALIVEAGP